MNRSRKLFLDTLLNSPNVITCGFMPLRLRATTLSLLQCFQRETVLHLCETLTRASLGLFQGTARIIRGGDTGGVAFRQSFFQVTRMSRSNSSIPYFKRCKTDWWKRFQNTLVTTASTTQYTEFRGSIKSLTGESIMRPAVTGMFASETILKS